MSVSNNISQPTVLVKKADGTTVRMTLAELQNMRTATASAGPRPMAVAKDSKMRHIGQAQKITRPENHGSSHHRIAGSVNNNKPTHHRPQPHQQTHQPHAKPQPHSPQPGHQGNSSAPKAASSDAVKISTHALTTSTPVTKIFVDEAAENMRTATASAGPRQMAVAKVTKMRMTNEIEAVNKRYIIEDANKVEKKPWKKEDTATLLEEKLEDAHVERSAQVAGSDTDAAVASRVLATLGWTTSADVRQRLESLIMSRLKDVRTDDQFLATAMTPTYRGGAGLSPDQAQTLHGAVLKFLSKSITKSPTALSASPTLSPALPRPIATTADTDRQRLSESEHGSLPREQAMGGGNESPRPMIRDIVPPPRRSTGPTEEFANFSLNDWRRLAPTTGAALSRLKEKFDVLKQESYLNFMAAREAWYESPLYRQYIDSILSAWQSRMKLAETLEQGGREALPMEILQAMVELNQYLSV